MATLLPMACALAMPLVAGASEAVAIDKVAAVLKRAQANDTIYIADGIYQNVELKWKAPGHSVVVQALNPGKVTITGNSTLRLSGDSLTIAGLDFRHASPTKGALIEFRIGKELANASRLTNCVIDSCNPQRRDISYHYVVLNGKSNRIDHCDFTGKLNLGLSLLVNLNEAGSVENNCIVDHNYFGYRPVYGSNGAETIRIGSSRHSYINSGTIIEDNYFERCNGEVEVVSVKASNNFVRNNIFDSCEGIVALRHGRNNTVANNIFYGRGIRNTGGVRVVDSGHEVYDNKFIKLAGTRFFSSFALMNSVPNSLPNRYVQVENVNVHDNLFYDCKSIEFGCGKDNERTQAPLNCSFTDNTIITKSKNPYIFLDSASDVRMSNNVISDNFKNIDYEKILNDRRKQSGATRGLSYEAAVNTNVIELAGGDLICTETIIVDKPTIIKCSESGVRPKLIWKGNSAGDFITIVNGGTLEIQGIDFDFSHQQGYATARNGITTAKEMITQYKLKVKDCRFVNSTEGNCCAIRGQKSTFADSVTVIGCYFADLSGNGIFLSDETDDIGRYSADDIVIENCKFNHMLGIPVNIYRGGSDESTAGPYVQIKGCSFNDCCNRERGSVMRLIGPQILDISNCVFNQSGRGGATIRLDEASWESVKITGCEWLDSGRVISNRKLID